ncbi:MAG: hypothetical protein IPG89_01980 [Bacteroidetes bacterium]|nr:hypothetical protein [Bacteroidota bacterium]
MDISLEESVSTLNEIEISASKKNETNNELSSVSGRSFFDGRGKSLCRWSL